MDQKLLKYSKKGNLTKVKKYLSKGANVNTINEVSASPLILALANGHQKIAEILLQVANINVNLKTKNGNSAITWACQKGFTNIVSKLLEKGADVNSVNNNSASVLMLALSNEHQEIANVLLQVPDIDVNLETKNGNSAITWACVEGFTNIVSQLLEKGANVNSVNDKEYTCLMLALENNNQKIANLLLKVPGIDVNMKGGNGDRAIIWACQKGYNSIIKQLLEKGADINSVNEYDGSSCLIVALEYYKKETANYLLQVPGIDIKIKDEYGNSAITSACGKGFTKIVKQFLEKGANVNSVDEDGASCLILALENYRRKTANLLLQVPGIDINLKTKNGKSAFTLACKKGFKKIVKRLLEKGVDVNTLNDKGESGLMLALEHFKVKVVDVLLQVPGIDVNLKSKDGNSAIVWACKSSFTDIVKQLLEKGADINSVSNKGIPCLLLALKHYSKRTAEMLLQDPKIDVNLKAKNGNNAMTWTCKKGFKKIVKQLLKKGADVNSVNNKGTPCLILALINNHPEIAKMLLQVPGIDVNLKSKNGNSAITWACQKGYKNIVKKLLEKGANVNSVDTDGNSGLILSLKSNCQEIVKLLLTIPDINVLHQNNKHKTALDIAFEKGYYDITESMAQFI